MPLSLGEDDKDFLRSIAVKVDLEDTWEAAAVRSINVRLTANDVMQCKCGETIVRFY